jgi:hypothetical protein
VDAADRVTQLQGRLGEAVSHVRSLSVDDDSYGRAADEAIDLARDLVDLEEQLPVLLDHGPHRGTVLLVRATAAVLGATAAGLAVAAVLGGLSLFWVLLAVPPAVVAVLTLLARVPALPPVAHRRHRAPAVVALAGDAGLVLAATGRTGVSGWLVLAGAVLLLLAGVLTRRLR